MQEMIGRYRILGRLGSGGYGEVLLAEADDGRRVALKLFEPREANLGSSEGLAEGESIETLRERFVTEARILGTLSGHPHIVDILDFGERADGAPFYVMPFLGTSFADELGRDVFDQQAVSELPEALRPRSVPVDRVLEVAVQLIGALEAVHGAGLVHRDIKPANILFDEEGQAKLIDFGIAKLPDAPYSTALHVGLGHRNYMAPEQRECAKYVDARSDLYSLGVVLYRALTGKLPVGRYPDPRDAAAGVDRALNDLVLRLLAEERSERPQDVAAVRRSFPSLAARSKSRIHLVDIAQIAARAQVMPAAAAVAEAGGEDVGDADSRVSPTSPPSVEVVAAGEMPPVVAASDEIDLSRGSGGATDDASFSTRDMEVHEPEASTFEAERGDRSATASAAAPRAGSSADPQPSDHDGSPHARPEPQADLGATFEMPVAKVQMNVNVPESSSTSAPSDSDVPAASDASASSHAKGQSEVDAHTEVDDQPKMPAVNVQTVASPGPDDDDVAVTPAGDDPRYVALTARVDALLDQWGVLGEAERLGLRPMLAVAGLPEQALDALVEGRQAGDPRREGKRNLVELIQSDLHSLPGPVSETVREGYLAAAESVGWGADDIDQVLARVRGLLEAPTRPSVPESVPASEPVARPAAVAARAKRWPWLAAAALVSALLAARWTGISGPEAPDQGQIAWQEASAAGTPEALEGFLADWAERPEAQEARQRLQALQASAEQNVARAQKALIIEAQGLLRQLGQAIETTGQIDESTQTALDAVTTELGVAWSEPLQSALVDALRTAVWEADREAWEAALKTNSARALEAYAQRFPQGVGQAELASRLEEARAKQAARARRAEIQRKAEEERRAAQALEAEAQAKAEEERRLAEAAEAEAARLAAEETLRRNAGFVEAGEGLLRDTLTGLVWTRQDNGAGVSGRKAEEYCAARSMRLPLTQELVAIHARSGADTASCGNATCRVSRLFVLSGDDYWSDRKRPDSDGQGLNLATGAKLRFNIPLIDSVRALCVRD